MTRARWNRMVAALCALALVAGCTNAAPPKDRQTAHRHVSPPSMPAPEPPAEGFDRARADAELAAARAADAADRAADARQKAEAAVRSWPGNVEAWEMLSVACGKAKDPACASRAAFFHDKVVFANALPARTAALGFQTVTEDAEAGATPRRDPERAAAARRLWAFYSVEDSRRNDRQIPTDPSFAEEYPFGTMLLAGGLVGGVLTVAKSMASK